MKMKDTEMKILIATFTLFVLGCSECKCHENQTETKNDTSISPNISIASELSCYSGEKVDESKKWRIESSSVGRNFIVLGRLPVPIGNIVTLAGTADRVIKGKFRVFVHSIDGTKLESPITLWISEKVDWKQGNWVKFTGSEVATLTKSIPMSGSLSYTQVSQVESRQILYLDFEILEILELKINANDE